MGDTPRRDRHLCKGMKRKRTDYINKDREKCSGQMMVNSSNNKGIYHFVCNIEMLKGLQAIKEHSKIRVLNKLLQCLEKNSYQQGIVAPTFRVEKTEGICYSLFYSLFIVWVKAEESPSEA